MRNKIEKGILLAIGLLWLSAACGGEDEVSPAEQTANACRSMCAKRELCDSGTDESDCVDACRNDKAIAASVFQFQADCADEASCDELTDGTFEDCVDDSISDLAPSSDGESFCEDYSGAWETCDGTADETEIQQACDDVAGAFTEDYIDAIGECLDDPCDGVAGCLGDVADDFDTAFVVPFFGGAVDEPTDPCCTPENACDFAEDGFCDCGGTQTWDEVDCAAAPAGGN